MDKEALQKQMRRDQIQKEILKLTDKIIQATADMKKYGPKFKRQGFKMVAEERSGMVRNSFEGARKSLMAARKNIYKLQAELKSL